MNKNIRNFIAKLLVLCILVGLLPTIALAAGTAGNGGTYTYVTNPDTTPKPETTVTEEVPAKATTDASGTAKADVSSADMDKAVEKVLADAAEKNAAPVVEIKVETSADATSLEVAMPAASLKTLAAKDESKLSVSSDVGGIELDHTALSSLVGQAAGSDITLEVAPTKTEDMNSAQTTALASATDAAVYDLSLKSGGTAISSFKQGKEKGQLTITLPYAVPAGSRASDVRAYYLDDLGKFERHRDASHSGGKVNFTTSHLSTYVITTTPMITEFTDVANGQYYTEAVDWAVAHDITTGMTATTFAPGGSCTRAQIVTFLWRSAGEPAVDENAANPFTDVAKGEYYYDAVLWAVGKGITTGATATTFDPNGTCTRAQIVTFLYRYKGQPAVSGSNSFTDVVSGEYYVSAVNWAVANGITTGMTATTFGPAGNCQRGQAVTFLYRMNDLA